MHNRFGMALMQASEHFLSDFGPSCIILNFEGQAFLTSPCHRCSFSDIFPNMSCVLRDHEGQFSKGVALVSE